MAPHGVIWLLLPRAYTGWGSGAVNSGPSMIRASQAPANDCFSQGETLWLMADLEPWAGGRLLFSPCVSPTSAPLPPLLLSLCGALGYRRTGARGGGRGTFLQLRASPNCCLSPCGLPGAHGAPPAATSLSAPCPGRLWGWSTGWGRVGKF